MTVQGRIRGKLEEGGGRRGYAIVESENSASRLWFLINTKLSILKETLLEVYEYE